MMEHVEIIGAIVFVFFLQLEMRFKLLRIGNQIKELNEVVVVRKSAKFRE